MNNRNAWIWSVTPENWEIVKKKKIWATKKKPALQYIKKNDIIVFYVIGTGSFKGVFEIISDWYNAKEPIWDDEDGKIIYKYQCKLKTIKIGDAVFNELANKLSFTKDKINNSKLLAIALRTSSRGPSNFGKPISKEDYELILNSMGESIEYISKMQSSNHEDIINKLIEIGSMLGFDCYTDRDHTYVAKGSIVDLVWETKIANIGRLQYVFEVQSGGSKKSAITNLIQALNNQSVKKVIIVSDKKQLDEIKSQLDYMRAISAFRDMFVLLDINDVNECYNTLPIINKFKERLQLF